MRSPKIGYWRGYLLREVSDRPLSTGTLSIRFLDGDEAVRFVDRKTGMIVLEGVRVSYAEGTGPFDQDADSDAE